ncbi:DUF4476 domain-containing protein [Hymenobacter sp. BT664]|uniref:DUF4476 domain-containing protein n=1 Tax=Hymenobacter montanus TaxID=2771359 RepID=A0A927BFM9_9BACT|nr:DUF4476 domain-containing protein [Hymenobacter montanus]MBD2769294.1 DUF4476 domain-containing protein [Hymenobacter montanus]
MKKALLLALVGLFTAVAPALAYPPPAALNFASERGVPFSLALDGRPLTRGVARQVHVNRLAPGAHWADFTVPTPYGRAVRFRSRVWLEPGLETSFVLVTRPGRPLYLRQVGAVALYGQGRGYGNGSGRYNNRPVPYNQGGYGDHRSPYDSNPSNNDYNDYNSRPNDPDSYDEALGDRGSYSDSALDDRIMEPQDVDALVQAVQQRPFEASKLSMAKEALSQSSIQADDLKRLLRSLNFEASRVELAKFAYPHVVDQQNFYRVYEAFSSASSQQEVQQAIGAPAQK